MQVKQRYFIACTLIRKLGKTVQTHPTIGSNYEEIAHNNVILQTWDVGGQESLRKIWDSYFKGANAIVFIIDSSDRSNQVISKTELEKLFNYEEIKNCIFLVLANKQDLKDAMSVEEIIEQFNLQHLSQNTWSIYGISAKTGAGIDNAFDWLIDNISLKKGN